MTVGIRASIRKALEKPRTLARIVSNIRQINAIEKGLDEVDSFKEWTRNFVSAREGINLVVLQ